MDSSANAVAPDEALTGVSSMATKAVLAELARAFEARTGCRVALESVGGVDAAKRVRAGEVFDVVVLAQGAIEELVADGYLVAGSQLELVRSEVHVAVRAGALHPDISSEDALRRVVSRARSIGTSTGPSGVELARLFERWGIAEQLRARVVTPPPGVPVGTLVARGEVELGFQQYSELYGMDGIDVLGPLPEPIRIVTTFSAAVGAAARSPERARAWLTFMASRDTADAKRRHGLQPA
jgi:molybdate transport system substrate-binding protein